MHKEKIHSLILFILLGVLAYLWLKPTGNIKPNGLAPHLALMLAGGSFSIYSFISNKKQWFINKNNNCAFNIALASIFILVHVAAIAYISIMMVIN